MELEMSVQNLPLPRPSFIELTGDAFIRNPHWKEDDPDHAGRDQLLAMTPDDRCGCLGRDAG
jgi:hypothetical protein